MRRRSAVLVAMLMAGSLSAGAAPASAQAPTSGVIRALAYNVAGLWEPISGSEPATNSRIISPLLNDYDLVLLQEDWGDPVEEAGLEGPPGMDPFFYHRDITSEVDHPYRSAPAPHPWGTDLRRAPHGPTLLADGLNRLSRWPFAAIDRGAGGRYANTVDDEVTRVMWRECFGDLALVAAEEALLATGQEDMLEEHGILGHEGVVDGGSSDCGAQKGFSVARTEIAPGVEIDVYNLHGDAGGHVNDIETRADNFAQLEEFIVEYSAGRAVLLGGDTNLRNSLVTREDRRERDGQVWTQFLSATGLTDACDALEDCGVDALAEEGFKIHDKFAFRSAGGVELVPLDFTYERDRFTRQDGRPLSDHDPLYVPFEWRLTVS